MDITITGTPGEDELIGTGADERLKGLAGDDIIEGGDGDDELIGNEGNDVLRGGNGADRLFGCEDDDLLDGGAGNDLLNAGSGNDILIFTAAENRSPGFDYYDGHNDIDRLVLNLTAAEFAAAESEINAFLAFIESTTGPTGESGGRTTEETGSGGAGQFFFFFSLGLAARRIEELQVIVDGEVIIGADPVAVDDIETVAANSAVTGSVAANDDIAGPVTYEVVDPPEDGTLDFNADGTFEYTPDPTLVSLGAGESVTRTFTYQVLGEFGAPVTAQATITITGVNDAPDAGPDLTATAEDVDAPFTIDLLDGATDPDTNDTLSVSGFTVVSGDASGVSGPDANGVLRLDPDAYALLEDGDVETIVISFDVIDGQGGSDTRSLTITINGTGVNNAPPVVTGPVAGAFDEDDVGPAGNAAFFLDLLAGASDPEGDPLSVASVSVDPAVDFTIVGSTLLIDTDQAAFQGLAAGETTELTLDYLVSDDMGGTTAQSGVITVTGTNDAPVASLLLRSSSEDAATFTINLLANATDIDGDTLSVVGGTISMKLPDFVTTTLIAEGTRAPQQAQIDDDQVVVDLSQFQFLGAGESDTINVSYMITDGTVMIQANAQITIEGANDAPTLGGALAFDLTEDDGEVRFDLLDGANDVDANDVLSIDGLTGIVAGLSLDGTMLVVDSGAFSGLAAGGSETITLNYTVTDGNGGTVAQTAVIEVTGINDAPLAGPPISLTFSEDDAASEVDPLVGVTDVDDGDVLSYDGYTLISGDDRGFISSLDFIEIDPSRYSELGDGETEVVVLRVDVQDEAGETAEQFIEITITGVNDAPNVGANLSATGDEDATEVLTLDVLNGVTDVEGQAFSVTDLRLISGDGSGVTSSADLATVSVDPSDYALAEGEVETIVIEADITDAQGATATRTLTFTVNGVNDAPVTDPITANSSEDAAGFSVDLLQNASDEETATGDLLVTNVVFSGFVSSPFSNPTFDGRNVVVDLSDYQELNAGDSFTFTVDYLVSDGDISVPGSAEITIEGQNDAPTSTGVIEITLSETDGEFDVDVFQNIEDVDAGDSLEFFGFTNLISGDDSGIITSLDLFLINPAAYTALNDGETEVIVIDAEISDAAGATVQQRIEITINGVSDPTNQNPPGAFDLEQTIFFEDPPEGSGIAQSNPFTDMITDPDGDTVEFVRFLGDIPAGMSFDAATGRFLLDTNDAAYDGLGASDFVSVTAYAEFTDGNGNFVDTPIFGLVTGTNDAPVSPGNLTLTTQEDFSLDFLNLLEGVTDADGDTLRIANVTGIAGFEDAFVIDAQNGFMNIETGDDALDFLSEGEEQTFVIGFDIVDGNGGVTARTASITVTGSNDGPEILARHSITMQATIDVNVGEKPGDGSVAMSPVTGVPDEARFRQIDLLAGTSDPEGDTLQVDRIEITSGSGIDYSGFVSLDANGILTIDFRGGDVPGFSDFTVTYFITDGMSERQGTVAVELIEATTNSDPTPSDPAQQDLSLSVTESTVPAVINLFDGIEDADGNTLQIESVVGLDSFLLFTALDFSTGELTLPNLDFIAEGETYSLNFDVVIGDGQGGFVHRNVSIDVAGENDAPEAFFAPNPIVLTEDSGVVTFDLTLAFTDIDGDDLSASFFSLTPGVFIPITLIDNQFIEIDAGFFDYLSEGQSVSGEYQLSISDGQGGLVESTFSVIVNGVNDLPTLTNVPRFFDNDVADYQEGENIAGFVIEAAEVFGDADLPGLFFDNDDVFTAASILEDPNGVLFPVTVQNGNLVFDPVNLDAALGAGQRRDFTVLWEGMTGDGDVITGQFTYRIEGTGEAPNSGQPAEEKPDIQVWEPVRDTQDAAGTDPILAEEKPDIQVWEPVRDTQDAASTGSILAEKGALLAIAEIGNHSEGFDDFNPLTDATLTDIFNQTFTRAELLANLNELLLSEHGEFAMAPPDMFDLG